MKKYVVGLLFALVAFNSFAAESKADSGLIPIPLNVKIISESYEPRILSSWGEVVTINAPERKAFVSSKVEFFINCEDKTFLPKSIYMYSENEEIVDFKVAKTIKPVSLNSGFVSMPPKSAGDLFINNSCNLINGSYKLPNGYDGFKTIKK